MSRYIHQSIGQDIPCLVGYYTILEEGQLDLNGRKILYIVENATIESSCCGSGGFGYIMVPGYILSWKGQKDKSGSEISEVERIEDEASRQEIRNLLKERYPHLTSIDFF